MSDDEQALVAWRDLSAIDRAILRSVAYRDLFDFPATAPEIHRYLPGLRCELGDVEEALGSSTGLAGRIETDGEFHALAGRSALFALRRQRRDASRELWQEADILARRLASLPFVTMVGVTGSLAANNAGEEADIDFMLITEGGRLWTCRAAAKCLQLADRILGSGRLCVNYLVTDRALVLDDQSLYTAQELAQMVPLYGVGTCKRMWHANGWARELLPNAFEDATGLAKEVAPAFPRLKRVLERVLRSAAGNALERWESGRKLRKYNETAFLLGRSTPFSPEATGHRKTVKRVVEDAFEDRLRSVRVGKPRQSVLFTEAYHLFLDAGRSNSRHAFPPVAALRGAALVRNLGLSVRVHDSVLAASLHEWQMALSVQRPDIVVICDDLSGRLAGVGHAGIQGAVLDMVAAAEAAGARVVIFGDAASGGQGAVHRGRGIETLSGGDFAGLASLLGDLGGSPAVKGAAPPAPAWDLIDLDRYAEIWERTHGQATIATVTSSAIEGNECRANGRDQHQIVAIRDIEDVVQELVSLERCGFEFVWFLDQSFGIEAGWVRRFADRLRESDSRMRFAARTSAELLKRPGEIEALSRAGCVVAWIGPGDDIREVREKLRDFGIQLGLQASVGGAGGLTADARAVLAAIREMQPDALDLALTRDGALDGGVRRILYLAWKLQRAPAGSHSRS